MNGLNNKLNNFSWSIASRPTTARMIVNDKFAPVPSALWATPVAAGDIALLWSGNKIIFTTKFDGGTFRDWCNAIYNGLHKTIDISELSPPTLKRINKIISGFIDDAHRSELTRRFSSGKLKIIDLMGDARFFEGDIHKIGGVWTYSLGS